MSTARIVDDMQTITDRTEAKVWLASINAPETEDRILWAQFLSTNPSVNQIHLASKIALEERERTASHLDEVVAALKAAQKVIEDMRSENKLHGHITDASANYLHHVKPLIDKALAGVADSGSETKGHS